MNNPFIEYQCVSITICDTQAIVESDSVFKLSERRFYAPPGIIKGFNT